MRAPGSHPLRALASGRRRSSAVPLAGDDGPFLHAREMRVIVEIVDAAECRASAPARFVGRVRTVEAFDQPVQSLERGNAKLFRRALAGILLFAAIAAARGLDVAKCRDASLLELAKAASKRDRGF